MSKIIIGNVEWLKNDYRLDIAICGIIYPTLEHAYQAAKTKDISIKQQIADTDSVREVRKIGKNLSLENISRETIMEVLLRKKFADIDLSSRLLDTGTLPIVMEGYDAFWGTGTDGDGQNVMGKLLEKIRDELRITFGIYDEDDDEKEEDVPTLKDALLNNPDEELATACQNLFEGAQAIVSVLDKNDYNASYIASKTGAPLDKVQDAISKVKTFQSVLTHLEELLETPSDDDEEDEEEEDEDEDISSID